MPVDRTLQRERVIAEIKRVATELGVEELSRSTFSGHSNMSMNQPMEAFGSWTEAVKAASLRPITTTVRKSDEELFSELLRICKQVGGVPTVTQLRQFSTYTPKTYMSARSRSWGDTLVDFMNWAEKACPDETVLLEMLRDRTNKPLPKLRREPANAQSGATAIRASRTGDVYGPPMNFRGLAHEPLNEQGVVFLFGKVSDELGFRIEAIRTGYPDCMGKRVIDRDGNMETVRIEFEYRSKNFLEHGHDPNKCDLLVCWHDDWPDCPLEVLELRKEIHNLSARCRLPDHGRSGARWVHDG